MAFADTESKLARSKPSLADTVTVSSLADMANERVLVRKVRKVGKLQKPKAVPTKNPEVKNMHLGLTCYFCKKRNHIALNCKLRIANNAVKCFKGGGLCHITTSCLKDADF